MDNSHRIARRRDARRPPLGDDESVAVATFAEAVDRVDGELRRELLREAQHWLGEWERARTEEARGRLLQALEDLALLIRAQAPR
jgi:hypothetical protein